MNRTFSNTEFYLLYQGQEYKAIEPDKFDQALLSTKRDKDFLGFITEFIDGDIKLLFTSASEEVPRQTVDAAEFLRNIKYSLNGFDSEGFDSTVLLSIRKNGLEIFNGKLALSESNDTDEGIECEIDAVSFEDLIRTRYDTKVEYKSVAIDGQYIGSPDYENIILHSKAIKKVRREVQDQEIDFGNFEIFRAFVNAGFNNDNEDGTYFYQIGSLNSIALDEINEFFTLTPGVSQKYDKGTEIETRTSWQEAVNLNQIPFPSEFFRVEETGNYTFSFSLNGVINVRTPTPLGRNFLGIELRVISIHTDNLGNVKSQVIHDLLEKSDLQGARPDEFWDLDLQGTHSFDAIGITPNYEGDKFYFVFQVYTFGQWVEDFLEGFYVVAKFNPIFNNQSFFNFEGITTTPPSASNAVLPFEAFERTIAMITGLQNRFRSSILGRIDTSTPYPENGAASQIMITNGYNIRGFQTQDRPLFFSLKDLFETFRTTHGLALGYEKENGLDIVRVEKREYFYKDVEILRFEEPSNYVIETWKDHIYNETEFGYSKYADEQVNNLDEFNTKQDRSTGIKSIKNKFKHIAKYIASGYLLEFARRKRFKTSSTEDTDQDTDNFLISCLKVADPNDSITESVQIRVFDSDQIFYRGVGGIENRRIFIELGSTVQISGTSNLDGNYTVNATLITSPQGNEIGFGIAESIPIGFTEYEDATLTYITSKTLYRPEKDEPLTSVSNILSPETLYNFRLSPLRCLLRQADWLTISTKFKDKATKFITFLKGELNFLLTTDWNNSEPNEWNPEISENDDLPLSALPDPYLIPEKHGFEHYLCPEDYMLLKRAYRGEAGELNYGYISVKDHRGIWNKLHLHDISYDSNKENGKFKGVKRFEP